jgi:DNA polymerase III delta subunit
MVKRGTAFSFEEAERILRSGGEGIPALTLGAGPDEYLRDRLVAAFRAGAEIEGSEFQRLEAEDLDADSLAGALASISLFASSRRIWIREGAKLDKGGEETLLAWTRGSTEGVRVLVTSARDTGDLKVLQAVAASGASVVCALRPGEAGRWVDRMITEAGLSIPAGAGEALAGHARDLLEARQEVEKLRTLADAAGKVSPRALGALREARAGGSLDRWADAVLARDSVTARRETAALDAERVGGTSALWAVAERALAALDPQSFAYRRGGAPRARITPTEARAALHAVYTADRALKQGDVKDAELRDWIERRILEAGPNA